MRFEYYVQPFLGETKRSWFSEQGPQHVAAELQNILNFKATEGWEYVRVEEIEIAQRVGCLVNLFMRKESAMYRYHQIVFRRPVVA